MRVSFNIEKYSNNFNYGVGIKKTNNNSDLRYGVSDLNMCANNIYKNISFKGSIYDVSPEKLEEMREEEKYMTLYIPAIHKESRIVKRENLGIEETPNCDSEFMGTSDDELYEAICRNFRKLTLNRMVWSRNENNIPISEDDFKSAFTEVLPKKDERVYRLTKKFVINEFAKPEEKEELKSISSNEKEEKERELFLEIIKRYYNSPQGPGDIRKCYYYVKNEDPPEDVPKYIMPKDDCIDDIYSIAMDIPPSPYGGY